MGAGASSAAPHDVALLVAIIDSLRTRQAEGITSILEELRSVYLDALPAARSEALKPVLEAAVAKYLEARNADQNATHEAAKEASLAAAGFAMSKPKTDSQSSPKSSASRESPPTSPDSNLVTAKPPPIPNTPPRAQPSPGAPAPVNDSSEAPHVESGESSLSSAVSTDTPIEASVAVSPSTAASPPSPSPQPSRKGGRNTSSMAERRRARQGKETAAEPLVPFLVASRSSFESAEIGGGTVYTTEL